MQDFNYGNPKIKATFTIIKVRRCMTFYYSDFQQSKMAEMEQPSAFFLVAILSSCLIYSTYGEYIMWLPYVTIDTLQWSVYNNR